MNYFLFLDETGDHGLSFIDKNFPLFLLCGCIVREDALKEIEKEINNFKLKYFKTTEVILHSREIRKCEGSFQILFDLDLKAKFYKDLNRIIKNGEFCLISSGIDKEEHIKKYGKLAKEPYSLSFSFILERLIFHLNRANKKATVEIFAEERGKKEDKTLLSCFNTILDKGTTYIKPDEFKKKIKRFNFCSKRDNVVGSQLADLCAYPLARHLINPKEPYPPFELIEKKIDCKKEGKYLGWGLKLFP